MLDALNRMMEQRQAGEDLDPSFESFMESFGDFFPATPRPSTSSSSSSRAQMAAVQAALDSMSPEQRAQLQALAESLFEDMDLRWQMDRLAENLRRPCPGRVGAGVPVQRLGPHGPRRRGASARRLGEMDQLEQFLRSATSPGALAEVDLDEVAKYLGEDGARSLEALARLAKQLEEAGLIEQREGRTS